MYTLAIESAFVVNTFISFFRLTNVPTSDAAGKGVLSPLYYRVTHLLIKTVAMDKFAYNPLQAYIVTLVESPFCTFCSGHSGHLVWLPLGHYKHLALHFSIED